MEEEFEIIAEKHFLYTFWSWLRKKELIAS